VSKPVTSEYSCALQPRIGQSPQGQPTRYWAHPCALTESRCVGNDTRVWAFAHLLNGAMIGAECNLGDHCFVESGVRVGDRVTLKNGVALWHGVTLEDDVFVGPDVSFTNDPRPRAFQRVAPESLSATQVERGATLGAHATILCGRRVGRFAFVAAGAVVTHNVAPHALVMGNPARRTAWICGCTQRLARKRAGRWVCPGCTTLFVEDGGRLAPVPDALALWMSGGVATGEPATAPHASGARSNSSMRPARPRPGRL